MQSMNFQFPRYFPYIKYRCNSQPASYTLQYILQKFQICCHIQYMLHFLMSCQFVHSNDARSTSSWIVEIIEAFDFR